MMRKLLYIVNPVSGTSQKAPLHQIIESKTKEAGFDFTIFPSVASGDYAFLHAIIQEQGFTDIVIAGGDGTINQVVNHLRWLALPFGIIPCGSGNGLAFSAGIPKDPARALQIIFSGNNVQTDAFLINGSFACMLCGLGFDAQVAHDFANDPRRGLMTYVKKTVSNFFTAPFYPFTITVNKKAIQTDAFFISIANSNQFGNQFTIAPQASLTDGLLDIVIMTRQNKISVLLRAFMQVGGYNKLQEVDLLKKDMGVIYFQTPSIRISNPGKAPLHIDGDPVETSTEIEVELIPRCFRLIQ